MILKVFYLRQLVYTVSTHTEKPLWANMYWCLKFFMVTRTWSKNTQPARWIIATLSFNCGSPMGAVEEVGCTCPWRDRACPRHTHPVPSISADSLKITTLDHYYRSLVDILISWFLSGMATRTWSRNTRPAHWIIAILSFNCGCLQAK